MVFTRPPIQVFTKTHTPHFAWRFGLQKKRGKLKIGLINTPMFHPLSEENSGDLRLRAAGCHIISNFETERRDLLDTHSSFKNFIEKAIERNILNKVGEAYHDFDGGGFTGVICLAESHLSIHTWPAQGYVTFDIFLSNFTVDNSPKAKAIYRDVVRFFDANIVFEKNLAR